MRGSFLAFWILALAAMLFLSPLCAEAEGTWYLRVVAQDDTPAAQAEKLRVRDAVWALCPADAAALPRALPAISATAGGMAPCRTEIRLWTPDKKTPVAPTVYITIGAAEGHNWWGVLYEDSLLLARAEEQPLEQPQEEVVFLWPWLTWLRNLLFGN